MTTTIVKMIFGSHLYGTDTPDSDRDYKGVFLPERNDILLGRIPKHYSVKTKQGSDTRNTPDDVDTEFYSLHYFIELGKAGETAVLDMLHAPPDMLLETSPIWDAIVANRHRFYTRTLKALVGYARRQAAKYGIKGSRLNDVKRVLAFLTTKDPDDKLSVYWDRLPEGDHIHKLDSGDERFQFYQVAGRKYLETVKVSEVGTSLR